MPEVYFTVELPDGAVHRCYSPSTIVKSYFREAETMPVHEFLDRSREALNEASERVRRKYGFGCTSALGQLLEIGKFTKTQPPEGEVTIVTISD